MNKKFSTLMASLLLASAFVGTAQAIDVKDAKAGQYYQLVQKGYYNGSWAAETPGHVLVDNGQTFAQYRGATEIKNQSDYWTIETRVNSSGDTEARFVNVMTGRALKLGDETWFKTVRETHAGVDENLLYLGGIATQIAVKNGGAEKYWSLDMKSYTACDGANFYAIGFDADPVAATQYTADELNKKLGSSFGLRIGFKNDDKEFEDYTLQGAEAFQGNLVAKTEALVSGETSGIAAPASGFGVHIWNASAKKYVVLTKNAWGSSIDADGINTNAPKGYKFALMSASEIKADLAKGDKRSILTATFKITGEANKDGRLEVAAVGYDGTNDAELYVYKNDGKYYLTVNKAKKNVDGTLSNSPVDNEASYMTSTWVKFGVANNLNVSDFYGYAVTIKGVKGDNKGKTLYPWGYKWINTEYVGMTKPEGQWIVTTDETGAATWTNRETGATTTEFDGMRLVEGNIYTTGAIGDVDQLYEITKTDKLGGDSYEYYGEYEANNAVYGEPHNYKIAFKNATSGVVEYVSINGKGELILTNNKSAAIVFDLWKTKLTNDMNANGTVKKNALVDRFHIVNNAMLKNKKGEWEYVADADTVSFYRYNFVYDGKYLAYNDNDRLTLSSSKADAFVIKEKDGDAVNIINVDKSDFDNDATYNPDAWVDGRDLFQGWSVSDPKMLYFDENKAILRQDLNIYNWNANAQLTIDDKDEIAYRKLAAPATMEFFRTEYSDEFLFEHGDFLGMTYNREKYNPAIYVDTAYVRGETKKPLYMLAVGVNETAATTYCPVHGVGATCEHAEKVPGLISARYLVSLTDSVAKYGALLNNPFCYTGTKLEKLGFVPATHVVDSVYIPTVGEKSTKYVISGTGVTPITFAFRIVNAETEDFVIETAKLNAAHTAYNVAYVKWHNGCPVLTEDIREAEVFNVRATEAEATANEAIAAEGVQVIGGQGVVTVQGAAGKVVTVANILGQTLANQVAASDNVTIAVPAGIVVVAVDGEATKVVVK